MYKAILHYELNLVCFLYALGEHKGIEPRAKTINRISLSAREVLLIQAASEPDNAAPGIPALLLPRALRSRYPPRIAALARIALRSRLTPSRHPATRFASALCAVNVLPTRNTVPVLGRYRMSCFILMRECNTRGES